MEHNRPDDLILYQTLVEVSNWIWKQTITVTGEAGYLSDQARRAFDSIGANLAEGLGRKYPGSMLQFVRYSLGSAYEAKFWFDALVSRGLIEDTPDSRKKNKLVSMCLELLEELEIKTKEEADEDSLTRKRKR